MLRHARAQFAGTAAIASLIVLTGTTASSSVLAESVLEEMVVLGSRDLSRSTSVGKLDISVTETPFSVSVRDKEFLDTIGAKTVQDSLLHVAGVNGGTYGIDSRGDWSTIRGVSPVTYIDGLQSLYGSYTGARAAAYAYERVEVLKGPSSVLYGQGSTGGVVNLVSKRPSPEGGGEFLVQGGSYDRRVVAADYSGKLDESGEWLYRLVGYYRDADAQVERVPDDSVLFMPSLSWRPTENTNLTLLYSKQADETGTTAAFLPWQGTLLPNPNGDIPTDTFISEPGWDKYDTDQDNYSVWFQHRFNPVWSINANARYSEGSVDYNSMWPAFTRSLDRFQPDMRTVTRTAYASDATSELWIYDLRATAEFNTGLVEHMLAFGVDSLDAESDKDTWRDPAGGGTIDVFNPVYGNIPTGYEITDNPATTTEQVGIYLQDQMQIGKVIVNAGFRSDETEKQTEGSAAEEDDANTMRLGLMYAFDSGLSPYVGYTESFEPVDGTNDYGVPFKPIEGEQVEAGLKYQPPGSNLLFTASRYEIVQKNRRVPDPNNPDNQIQTGETELDGYEMELSAKWAQLDLIANFSTIDFDDSLTAVPEDQYSAWGIYHFAGDLNGLRMGMGVRYVGESETGLPGFRNPDYTLYDAFVGYDYADWRFQLNANNLTDEVHTTSCLSRGDCFMGERRYVTAEARYAF